MKKEEYILCAAIWYKCKHTDKLPSAINISSGFVVTGYRHCHCQNIFAALRYGMYAPMDKSLAIQGFLTSRKRFVDRKEAMKIAIEQKQTDSGKEILFSEDLY